MYLPKQASDKLIMTDDVSMIRIVMYNAFVQVARKLVIVEGELERTEERAELAEA